MFCQLFRAKTFPYKDKHIKAWPENWLPESLVILRNGIFPLD
jgi:hypothetical protein